MNNSTEFVNCTLQVSDEGQLGANIGYIVQIVHIILVLIFNVTLFVTIIHQKLLWQKKSCQFLLNLLVVHSCISLVLYTSQMFPSNIKMYIKVSLLLEMVFSLIFITWDRYQDIRDPFKYENISPYQLPVVLITSWLLSLALFCVTFFLKLTEYYLRIIDITIVIFALNILPPLNTFVYCVARKHVKIVLRYIMATNPNVNKEIKRLKSTYAGIVISSTFLLCWLPYCVYDIFALTTTYCKDNIFLQCVEGIALLNSLLHPIFIVAFRPDVKKEMKRLFNINQEMNHEYSFDQGEVDMKVQNLPVECKEVSRKVA